MAVGVLAAGRVEAAPRSYDIPAGDLRSALRAFAQQSDWQILFTSDLASGRTSNGFSGRAADTEVLGRILTGTGLAYRIANAETLLIVAAPGSRAVDDRTAPPASAQPGPHPGAPERVPVVEEVVVTATRQAEPVQRVPLSVTAETQRSLDQRGVHVLSDFIGVIPAMQMTQTSPGVSNIVLRGVANTASAATAPTTGFYLDDTPIHKRNAGGFINNNGTPLPPLFDLDRVEVLRGPQGTLFGGSSEGGTIRYITPQPSVSRYSTYVRAELSRTRRGGTGHELGAAVGGPIVTDRLGFRASVYERRSAGFIDYISPYTGAERLSNVNGGRTRMLRVALAWAPDPRLRVTLAYLSSAEHSDSNVAAYTLPTTAPIVDQPVCYDTSAITPERPFANPAPVPCGSPGVTFRREGAVYGPYPDLKSDDLVTAVDPSPTKTHIRLPSLTVDYRFPSFSARSITSYVSDETRSQQFATGNEFNLRTGDVLYAAAPPSREFPDGGRFRQGLGLFTGVPEAGRQAGPVYGFGYGWNRREGLSQEVRLSSGAEARPVSWVAGVFYSHTRVRNLWYVLQNTELISRALYGMSAEQRYGIGTLEDPVTGLPYLYDRQESELRDVEIAGFGEANLWVDDRLRLIAGIRVSREELRYQQAIRGAAAGFATPTEANRGLSAGMTTESPVTPKLGAVYQLSADDLVYVTAAKGFRPGGVNGALSPALCDPVLARFGLTSADVPRTFSSDAVWSYEAGAKVRLLQGRVQLAADAYQIDWTNIQTAVNFTGCGSPFVTNAGAGRVQGVELEGQARLGALRLEASVGRTRGRYTRDSAAPAGGTSPPLVTALRDQPFPTPGWSANLAVRYDLSLSERAKAYVRGDWRWTSAYDASVFGVPGYSPDTARAAAVSRANLRLGVEAAGLDVALFASNLFNERDGLRAGGRSGCTVSGGPSCTAYGQFAPLRTVAGGTPRQIGVQVSYRR